MHPNQRYASKVNKARLSQYVARARAIVELAQHSPIPFKRGVGNYNRSSILPKPETGCDTDGFIAHVLEIDKHPTQDRPYVFNRLNVWQEGIKQDDSRQFMWCSIPFIGCIMVQPNMEDGIMAIVTDFTHDNARITSVRGIDCNKKMHRYTKNSIQERDLTHELHGGTRFFVKVEDAH